MKSSTTTTTNTTPWLYIHICIEIKRIGDTFIPYYTNYCCKEVLLQRNVPRNSSIDLSKDTNQSVPMWLYATCAMYNNQPASSILIIIIWEILKSSIVFAGTPKQLHKYIGILKSMDKLIITICLHQFVFTTTVYYYSSSSYHQGYSLCCMFEGNQIQNSRTLQQEIQLPELLIQMQYICYQENINSCFHSNLNSIHSPYYTRTNKYRRMNLIPTAFHKQTISRAKIYY